MNVEEFRTLRWADYFIYTLTNPVYLCKLIKRNEPKHFALGFFIPAGFAFIDILTSSLLQQQSSFFTYKVSYGWIMLYAYIVIKVLLMASLMDMMAQFRGYKGNIREMISLVNFSLFPRVFILPLVYIFRVLDFAVPIAPMIYTIGSIALFIWSSFIIIRGIAEMHDSGLGGALLIFSFPLILTLLFSIIIGVLGYFYFKAFFFSQMIF